MREEKQAHAPSSLAGGEALDRFERAAFAKVQNLPRGTASRAEEIARRDAEYDAARNAILAALSPEAPARIETPIDALVKALTPRHEAPAEGAGEDELIERGLRTIRAYDAVRYLRDALSATTARLTGYDWNADPDGVTKQQGDAFAAADKVFADLDAAVASHPEIELPECRTCGGTGKIEEAARTEGANQHSACVRTCDDCDGCGFAPDDESEPLRAPSREPEGGAVDDGAFKIATDLHKAYEQLIYGLPKYLDAENLTDEENMIREAWVTLDVTAHRLAALATREDCAEAAMEAVDAAA